MKREDSHPGRKDGRDLRVEGRLEIKEGHLLNIEQKEEREQIISSLFMKNVLHHVLIQ